MTGWQLLGHARAVLDGTIRMPGLSAPRAAALLARQALEDGLRERVRDLCPGLDRATARSQLICLRVLRPDTGLAAQRAWDGLCRACHHHAYELTPTDSEVRRLIALVDLVVPAPALVSAAG